MTAFLGQCYFLPLISIYYHWRGIKCPACMVEHLTDTLNFIKISLKKRREKEVLKKRL